MLVLCFLFSISAVRLPSFYDTNTETFCANRFRDGRHQHWSHEVEKISDYEIKFKCKTVDDREEEIAMHGPFVLHCHEEQSLAATLDHHDSRTYAIVATLLEDQEYLRDVGICVLQNQMLAMKNSVFLLLAESDLEGVDNNGDDQGLTVLRYDLRASSDKMKQYFGRLGIRYSTRSVQAAIESEYRPKALYLSLIAQS